MKLWQKNLILLTFVVLIAVLPLIFLKDAEFAGADSIAEAEITRIAPTYEAWYQPWFEPASGEIESLLFALQAAIGAGVVGYVLGRITAPKKDN